MLLGIRFGMNICFRTSFCASLLCCVGLKALAQMGVPVDGLSFDPEIAMRGLVIDAKSGNLLKVDRFGLVKRAMHGDKMLTPAGVQRAYGRELVHLSDNRWIFLNTLFSVSEGCLYMQVRD